MRESRKIFNATIAGLSQREAAVKLGVSHTYVNDLVHSRRRLTARVLVNLHNGHEILLMQAIEEAEEEWGKAQ